MGQRNKALQIVGLVIIIVSLVSTGMYFGIAIPSPHNSIPIGSMLPGNQELGLNNAPTTISSTSSEQKSSIALHNVQIAYGAGRPKSVSEPFFPGSLKIHINDTVMWTNQDTVGHTVTSTFFNSGMIWPKNSSQGSSSTYQHTFNKSGIFSYFCQIHPYMSGTVYVDVDETQRQLASTNHPGSVSIEIEMPQNAAYQNKFGPYFIPANAIVPSGTKVTWVNHDFIAHTATAGDGATFDTEPVLPSQSKSLIISGIGRIAYYCEIHPWMQGSITIINPNVQ